MGVILFDDAARQTLLPLTYTRPVADLRIGILTIAEKWGKHLGQRYSFHTQDYLSVKFPIDIQQQNLFINGAVCPDDNLLEAIDKLPFGEALMLSNKLLAIKLDGTAAKEFKPNGSYGKLIQYEGKPVVIIYPEHIFKQNDTEIRKDFALLTKGRTGANVSSSNTILGNQFFAEEGVEAACAIFNTNSGPIYLGKNSSVWEGAAIRGSFALCDESQVKMGTKIYPGTTVGPYCRVGGEINNAVIWGYSSKGHEGYLGNSVMGEWCNIGADSNNSNLKNNYADVRLWDYSTRSYRNTGLQFCGLVMADHTKCGINTMFNTGTVAGVGCNVFGAGFPPNFIPDFSWGGAEGIQEYHLDKMLETAERVFSRREHRAFNDVEKDILKHIFAATQHSRQ